jgi:hypothetical protein
MCREESAIASQMQVLKAPEEVDVFAGIHAAWARD